MNSGPHGDRPYRDYSERELFEQIRICEQNRTRVSREACNLQRIGDDDYKGFSALERSLGDEIRQIDGELAIRRIERGEIRKGSSVAGMNSSSPTAPDNSVRSPDDSDDSVRSSGEALFHGPLPDHRQEHWPGTGRNAGGCKGDQSSTVDATRPAMAAMEIAENRWPQTPLWTCADRE
jgi:hypothetical protein